jgi:hypothetical protein
VSESRRHQPHEQPAIPKHLRKQLTRQQRQEEQDLLRRYDDLPINDREPLLRWM